MDTKNKINNLNVPCILDMGAVSFTSRLTDYYDENSHSHSFYEISIVIVGSITHTANNSIEVLHEGDAFLICPGASHRFIRDQKCVHRDFLISKELFKSAADYINPDLLEEFHKKKFIRFKIPNNTILSLEDCISTFFETDNYLSRKNYEKILCCQLIGAIYADLQLSMHNAESFKSFCLTAMNENIKNPEALQVICQQLGYSYVYFCKKFKNKFGCTPTAYLNSIRIKNAAYLLLTSNCTLSECCEQIGISSIPYFIKLFKKQFGVTPSAYRSQNKYKS